MNNQLILDMIRKMRESTKDMVGHEYLYFSQPVTVRDSPHHYPHAYWAICAGPKEGQLYVMDDGDVWEQVTEETPQVIVESLYQRVRIMHEAFKRLCQPAGGDR